MKTIKSRVPTHQKADKRQHQAIAQELWLIYFNDTLLQKGVISQCDHDKMRIKINERTLNTTTNKECSKS